MVKVKLGADGYFHEIDEDFECDSIKEMHKKLKDKGEEVEE